MRNNVFDEVAAGYKMYLVYLRRYYFADQSKVTTTTAGENIIVNIIGSLFDAIEADHGTLPTRLYRAFSPKAGDFYI